MSLMVAIFESKSPNFLLIVFVCYIFKISLNPKASSSPISLPSLPLPSPPTALPSHGPPLFPTIGRHQTNHLSRIYSRRIIILDVNWWWAAAFNSTGQRQVRKDCPPKRSVSVFYFCPLVNFSPAVISSSKFSYTWILSSFYILSSVIIATAAARWN